MITDLIEANTLYHRVGRHSYNFLNSNLAWWKRSESTEYSQSESKPETWVCSTNELQYQQCGSHL